ncbi:nitroreductase [Sphaerochaeta pleomorpha str. Grapes]|uniref:Nitroreductase n=1 Tax=Sphaerochaeta pleomorpha (strain ATCC BAA-1885 / DSM 22778 / Grapes) TaxID=158190 RepID=G8QRV3_SPHPG|nr:nitroreductase family protein [Sphaerochaeta pleomorpha]AEV28886.1 nitroreductase [Sphaerochaeta pleomorpha str. Grapes]
MTFLEAMQTRFACKLYENRAIENPALQEILESARLTPTSFGLEMWAFHVVQSQEVKEKLYHACFDQESVRTAAVSIVTLARPAPWYDPDGRPVKEKGSRFPGNLSDFIEDFRPYHAFLSEHNRLDCWSRSQGYLAVANMMTCAALQGIQSCAIEGFDESKVLALLGLFPSDWLVSLVTTFGYPAEETRPKIRESVQNLVVYH